MSTPTLTESAFVALLRDALAPARVSWGWAPFESSTEPAALPLVTVQRLVYSTAAYESMCSDPYLGDTTLTVHAWALGYAQARTLSSAARAALSDAVGWRLQSESDLFEPTFRAWRVEGVWFAAGIAPE